MAASKTLARPATAIGVVTRALLSGRSTLTLSPFETSGLGAGEVDAVGVGDGVGEGLALGAALGLALADGRAGLEVSVATLPEAHVASASASATARQRRLTSLDLVEGSRLDLEHAGEPHAWPRGEGLTGLPIEHPERDP